MKASCKVRSGPGLKRLFDLCVSTLLLLLTIPVLAIAAAFIFMESGFPLIYRQERVGQVDVSFRCTSCAA